MHCLVWERKRSKIDLGPIFFYSNTMSMNQSSEFNILGCSIRIKTDEENNNKALKAVSLLNDEISKLKKSNSKLKDVDVAVLGALSLATKLLEKDEEYKVNVFALKTGVEDALNFIEEVSPGSMQTNT